ncbi:MAG: hypothetical protein P1U68_03575 [Verrucomicrobiales bacterium]|nr:hypothetical protein [Verrucomicrobiales bacterium]
MAKGREQHQARLAHLSSFGKELTRRAKSKCELCEAAGRKLAVVELPPEPREPEIERCLMLCDDCAQAVLEPKRFQGGDHWRCLAQTVWSGEPAIQAAALRLLKRQEGSQPWAREALETMFAEEEVETLAGEAD